MFFKCGCVWTDTRQTNTHGEKTQTRSSHVGAFNREYNTERGGRCTRHTRKMEEGEKGAGLVAACLFNGEHKGVWEE